MAIDRRPLSLVQLVRRRLQQEREEPVQLAVAEVLVLEVEQRQRAAVGQVRRSGSARSLALS
jgi:hypothetical protein